MRNSFMSLTCASLVGLLTLAVPARADVSVRAPFVRVHVGGPGVYVGVFGIPVAVVNRSQPPVYKKKVKRSREVLPAPQPVVGVDEKIPNLAEFLDGFQPRGGRHVVTVLHPTTKEPVTVSFRLPPGKPKEVRLLSRELEFDYGNRGVDIRFLRNGRVRVLYD